MLDRLGHGARSEFLLPELIYDTVVSLMPARDAGDNGAHGKSESRGTPRIDAIRHALPLGSSSEKHYNKRMASLMSHEQPTRRGGSSCCPRP
jgi:hypothetical protein